MRGIYEEIIGQRHEFLEKAFIHILRTAAGQVCPSALADKERIAGEDAVAGNNGDMVLGMAFRFNRLKGYFPDMQLVPVPKVNVDPHPGVLGQDLLYPEEFRHFRTDLP